MPNGGIDALMPHYSNPILINDLLDETTTTTTTPSLSSSASSFMAMSINSNHLKSHGNNNGYQNFSTTNTPITSSNGLLDLSLLSSSVSNDDMVKHKRFAQQQLSYKKLVYEQQQRLIKIENDINKAYSYYVQALNERRDNLVKEFQAIVQFVHKQNQNKLLLSSSGSSNGNDVDTDTDASKIVATKSGKKNVTSSNGEKLINNGGDFQETNNSFFDTSNGVSSSVENDLNSSSSNEMQSLINTHLMAIEFVSNYANIQAAVRNSFGYIR
jgi:hypothetical protein